MHPDHGSLLHDRENSSDPLCLTSKIHPVQMLPAPQATEYYGINPTGIQNDFPSLCHHASYILCLDQKFHRRLHPQYPSPLRYEYANPASDRHAPKNMLLQERPNHFQPDKHFFLLHLPVFSDAQMLHNFHYYNKFLCCFFRFFLSPYYDNPIFLSFPFRFFFSFLLFYNFLLQQLLPLLLQVQFLLPDLFSYPYKYHLSKCFFLFFSISGFSFFFHLQNKENDKKLIILPVLIKLF